MNKFKIALALVLALVLLGLAGCKPEAVTTTVKSTTTAAAPTVTATSTVTGAAQTVTVTETKIMTVTAALSQSTTTPSTTKTTTTTSTPTTTVTIEFTPVTSPDGKLQVVSAVVAGSAYEGDTGGARISLRGVVRNLTADETLKAQVTVEFFTSAGSLGSYSTELPITVGPGAEKNYVVETNQRGVTITAINVSVVVIP